MYKFPGRQKVTVSKKHGFTDIGREEYLRFRREGLVRDDGAYVQFWRKKGGLMENIRRFPKVYSG